MEAFTVSTPQILQPTMRLRIVDTSTIPQLSTQNVLQQMFVDTDTGEEVWRDVPHVGHIADLDEALA